METKRWIAGAAALALAGSGSLFLASTASGQEGMEPDMEHDGHDHGEEETPTEQTPGVEVEDDGEGNIDIQVEGEVPPGGGEAEGAPPVTEEPGFTG